MSRMKSQNRKHRTCSQIESELTVSFKSVMELGCLMYRNCRSLKRHTFSLLLFKVIFAVFRRHKLDLSECIKAADS